MSTYRQEAHGVVAEAVLTVALAIQIVVSAVLIVVSALEAKAALGAVGVSASPNLGAIGVGVGIATGLLLIVAYARSYAPARRGYYGQARTPTLVLGILFVVLIVTALIGVLYLFAYARLRDAEPPYEPLG